VKVVWPMKKKMSSQKRYNPKLQLKKERFSLGKIGKIQGEMRKSL